MQRCCKSTFLEHRQNSTRVFVFGSHATTPRGTGEACTSSGDGHERKTLCSQPSTPVLARGRPLREAASSWPLASFFVHWYPLQGTGTAQAACQTPCGTSISDAVKTSCWSAGSWLIPSTPHPCYPSPAHPSISFPWPYCYPLGHALDTGDDNMRVGGDIFNISGGFSPISLF